MESRRHYLGWKRPFSIEFAEFLKRQNGSSRSYDKLLIWTPSSRAGRHVLNLLFNTDSGQCEAFHPPEFVTPVRYVRSLIPVEGNPASEGQLLYVWKSALESMDPAALQPLFPVIPSEGKSRWAFTVAQQLMELRGRLAEEQLDFRSIAGRDLPHDKSRWTALAGIEGVCLQLLSKMGLEDPDDLLAKILDRPLPAQPHTRLLVAGVLNLTRRQSACIQALEASGIEVEFFLPVPEERSDQFDSLGRPLKGRWEKEALPEPLLEACLQRAPDPRELVDEVLALSGKYGSGVDKLVVGTPERDLADYLIERSHLTETPYYAPEGKAIMETSWGRLLDRLRDWQQGGAISGLFELLNHELFREWACSVGIDVPCVQKAIQDVIKRQLLKNRSQLLDGTLGPSKNIGIIRECISALEKAGFQHPGSTDFPGEIWKLLRKIAVSQELTFGHASVLKELEEQLQNLRQGFRDVSLSMDEWWELLEFTLSSCQFYPERSEIERPVSGWLELPWESAPHLVLLSLPDTQVPGPKGLDSFLTPALCDYLGLYGHEDLAAFHAFRLRLLLESRKAWGRVDILLPDRALDDSPVLPSRFLFLSDEATILTRVDTLLGDRSISEKPLAAGFGSRISPPRASTPESISVTAFRAYLQNPFHFYLETLGGWSAPEPLPREMDPFVFGNLAHSVLEELNGSEQGIALKMEKDITAFLLEGLEKLAINRFGSTCPVSLRIQISSLAERFRAAAGIIARERQAGWVPVKVEWRFHKEIRFKIGGLELRGMVDLIEQNEDSGLYRIVDYKTSEKAVDPFKAHVSGTNSRSREPRLPECDFVDREKTWRWKDLQLPLYQKAVELLTGEFATCAYFNLSKAVGDIDIAEWRPNEEQRESAMAFAEAIVGQITAGRFPLEEKSAYEDKWLKWFGGDYRTNLDPDWLRMHGGTVHE